MFSEESAALKFGLDNPYLSDATRAKLIEIGADGFYLQRESRDLNPNGNGAEAKTNTWRFVGGLEGTFEMADRDFDWQVVTTTVNLQAFLKVIPCLMTVFLRN